jgi:small subunit ribosomal protein S10
MPLPKSVTAVYMRPLRRLPTHYLPVCNLQMRSYSVRNLEFFADFAMRAAYYLHLPARGPVPLPRITERWTVPRSNFIFKKSQENFERKTLRRLIQIQDGHPDVVKAWLGYLERRCFYGVGLKANIWEHEALGVAARMDEVGERIDKEMEGEWRNFGTRKSVAESKEAMEKLLGDERFAMPIEDMEAYKREPIEIKRR